jgi:hypothetical protein
VEWYHASQFIWNAATTIQGDRTAARSEWAQQQLEALWEGRIADVMLARHGYTNLGDAVDQALS